MLWQYGGVERFYSTTASGEVTVREGRERRPLNKRLDLSQHLAEGFAWGNDKAGAQQLALALLADALSDDTKANQTYHEFASRVVSILPARWTITRTRILRHVAIIDYEQRVASHIFPRRSIVSGEGTIQFMH
jgi:hypothetical protein